VRASLPAPSPHPNLERRNSTSPEGRRGKEVAFSLIELAIVLVILGLLVGGILTGQSLIRAAELRSVTTEYDRYVNATKIFRDKYLALPGDMPDATQFWGFQGTVAAPGCVSNSGAAVSTSGTCDGNDNGILEHGTAANVTSQQFQFWRQLASAGLIEGRYNGIAGPGIDSITANAGINSPTSKMPGSTWAVRYIPGVYAGDLAAFSYEYGNFLVFGGERPTEWPAHPNLKPEEAWNIDTKLDDGLPASGKIVGFHWTVCTTAVSNTDFSARYNLTNNNLVCILKFPKAF
jgi:hypothetical protein